MGEVIGGKLLVFNLDVQVGLTFIYLISLIFVFHPPSPTSAQQVFSNMSLKMMIDDKIGPPPHSVCSLLRRTSDLSLARKRAPGEIKKLDQIGCVEMIHTLKNV